MPSRTSTTSCLAGLTWSGPCSTSTPRAGASTGRSLPRLPTGCATRSWTLMWWVGILPYSHSMVTQPSSHTVIYVIVTLSFYHTLMLWDTDTFHPVTLFVRRLFKRASYHKDIFSYNEYKVRWDSCVFRLTWSTPCWTRTGMRISAPGSSTRSSSSGDTPEASRRVPSPCQSAASGSKRSPKPQPQLYLRRSGRSCQAQSNKTFIWKKHIFDNFCNIYCLCIYIYCRSLVPLIRENFHILSNIESAISS